MSTFGFPQSFAVELTFDSAPSVGTSDAVTRGCGSLVLGGQRVWPPTGDDSACLEWTWVEMLEHLATSWARVVWEEGTPFDLRPSDASGLWEQLEVQLEQGLLKQTETEQALATLEDYLQSHDLSQAIQGAVLPSFVLVREGRHFWLCAPGRAERHSERVVIRALEELGDHLAGRLQDATDERATHAISGWRGRLDRSPLERVTISVGRSSDEVAALSKSMSIEDYWDLDRTDLRDANELLAVARMAKSLSGEALQSVLEQVRQQPFVEHDTLNKLSFEAQFELAEVSTRRPFEQGYNLARWLRATLLTTVSVTEAPIDPEGVLTEWGIAVVDLSSRLLPVDLDAVSCWGELRGPTVFVNPEGLHAGAPNGRRTTLAHEICHLLVDRRGALPFAEVLTSDSKGRAESRANAFAAELLAPQAVVGPALSGDDFEAAFDDLRSRFGASAELVAWQARNSGEWLSPAALDYLNQFVSHPERFRRGL